jgi:hypothetical protein|tara:strand:+ start:84 stop:1268 length:1185 start_codon:yes stop_codon:yes gene_type:complete
MSGDLGQFFSLIGKAKKEKEDEFRSLVGEVDIDSMFSQVKESINEDKQKKKKEENQIKALESWLFTEAQLQEKTVEEKPVIVGVDDDKYEEWIEDELDEETEVTPELVKEIEEEEVEDTVDHALKILETIKSKEEVRENLDDPEIIKIRRELEYLKNLVNAQGGGGEVRLEFLDDVDRDSVKVDGKFLKYQASTGTFIGADASGGGGGGDSDYASSAGIATFATTAGVSTNAQGLTGTPDITVNNIVGVAATFTGNVSIAGTVTYDDVTNVDSVGIVTARSGVFFGSPTVSAILTNSATTTTTDQTSIDSFSASTYRSAKYQVQITRGSEYQVTEISIVHDGSDSFGTEYATIKTGETLSTFSTDISGGNVRLLATPSSSSSTVFKFTKTAIVV